MTKRILSLGDDLAWFIEDFTRITSETNDYYHIPFWFKKVSKGLYEIITFDEMPENLKQKINEQRGKITDTQQDKRTD